MHRHNLRKGFIQHSVCDRCTCNKYRNGKLSGGFTLIEMAVTVAIFALISSVIIARNAAFDSDILLQGLAYDMAISIRTAQQFGINVRVAQNQFDAPYGVEFTSNSTTYTMFIDKNGDGTYGGAASGELVEAYTIGRGAKVQSLCNIATNDCTLTKLDVLFKRPNPDAIINNGAISQARIILVPARQDAMRYIEIQSTGEISIVVPTS